MQFRSGSIFLHEYFAVLIEIFIGVSLHIEA